MGSVGYIQTVPLGHFVHFPYVTARVFLTLLFQVYKPSGMHLLDQQVVAGLALYSCPGRRRRAHWHHFLGLLTFISRSDGLMWGGFDF